MGHKGSCGVMMLILSFDDNLSGSSFGQGFVFFVSQEGSFFVLHQKHINNQPYKESEYISVSSDPVKKSSESSSGTNSEVAHQGQGEGYNPGNNSSDIETILIPVSTLRSLEQSHNVDVSLLDQIVVSYEDGSDGGQDGSVSTQPSEDVITGSAEDPPGLEGYSDDAGSNYTHLIGDPVGGDVGKSIGRSYYVGCDVGGQGSNDDTQ